MLQCAWSPLVHVSSAGADDFSTVVRVCVSVVPSYGSSGFTAIFIAQPLCFSLYLSGADVPKDILVIDKGEP